MMTSQPAPEQVDGSGPYVNAPPEKNRHLRRVASLYDPAVGLWDQYPLRPATWAGRMFTCPWCLSVWVAIPVAVGWWAPGPQHGALRAVLTVAAALEGAGLLARLES